MDLDLHRYGDREKECFSIPKKNKFLLSKTLIRVLGYLSLHTTYEVIWCLCSNLLSPIFILFNTYRSDFEKLAVTMFEIS